jgi:acetyl-CoA/propionyl-CoA carboxylase biotin carboxyl carrier protein
MSTATERPLRRVLIANRGEIALRVIRACRELGIAPIAVYGEGEERARHVVAADDAYRIPAGTTLPYLDIPALIGIATAAGADGVHPGYGFLAENASFARAVAEAGMVFIGPTPEQMVSMGDKVEARKIAAAAKVPMVPGTADPVASVDEARAWADANGYPVAVKAAGGGGGRGFRVAHSADELEEAFLGSAGEAQRYFANATVYLERYLVRPRHVEVQVFGDKHGNVVALGERDCSVQRRHQKLVEETPSPAVTPELRERMWGSAVALAKAVGYHGAGTVEFMLTPEKEFFFLEMNTRIQVEHTITEEVTGIDLVAEQVKVAMGRRLSFTQADVQPRGHAIQCRINAEDAGRDFKPTPGVLTGYREPGGLGVRVDSAMAPGEEILPTYDSLICKLVVHARDRDEAIARMTRALDEFLVEGVATTIPFHRNVMASQAFQHGDVTTAFLPENPGVIPAPMTVTPAAHDGEPAAPSETLVEVNGRRFTVSIQGLGGIAVAPAPSAGGAQRSAPKKRGATSSAPAASGKGLTSPIQGTVVRASGAVGDTVTAGQVLFVVEAMKMENEIAAHRDGKITAIKVGAGTAIKVGALLAEIE